MTVAEGNISEESVVEEHTGLLNESDILADPLLVEDLHRLAINLDISGKGLIKVGNEVADCALPRTTFANDESNFSGWEEK
jgi:hypothetical protein